MNRRWLFPAGVLAWCCLGAGHDTQAETAKKPVPTRWFSDWEQGRKAARDSGKPIFIVFRCEH